MRGDPPCSADSSPVEKPPPHREARGAGDPTLAPEPTGTRGPGGSAIIVRRPALHGRFAQTERRDVRHRPACQFGDDIRRTHRAQIQVRYCLLNQRSPPSVGSCPAAIARPMSSTSSATTSADADGPRRPLSRRPADRPQRPGPSRPVRRIGPDPDRPTTAPGRPPDGASCRCPAGVRPAGGWWAGPGPAGAGQSRVARRDGVITVRGSCQSASRWLSRAGGAHRPCDPGKPDKNQRSVVIVGSKDSTELESGLSVSS